MVFIDKVEGPPKTIKIKCAFQNCIVDFEPTNSKKRYCCDACRFRGHRARHKKKDDFLKTWRDKFKANEQALKKLLELKIMKPSVRDLQIAGFDVNIHSHYKETTDNRIAYVYFDYVLVFSPGLVNYEIIHQPNN